MTKGIRFDARALRDYLDKALERHNDGLLTVHVSRKGTDLGGFKLWDMGFQHSDRDGSLYVELWVKPAEEE